MRKSKNINTSTVIHGDNNVYGFICEGCGAAGELELPIKAKDLSCPEGCGARYIQWLDPVSNKYKLTCVVAPMTV